MPQTRLTPVETDFIMKLKQVEYSNSEIARKLGVTEGAIWYRLKRQTSGQTDGRAKAQEIHFEEAARKANTY